MWKKHWNAQYIIDRTRNIIEAKRRPNDPWLVPSAVDFLEQWLKPTDKGIEWGSGRSTIWFAQRVSFLTSIEHNPEWAEWVGRKIHDSGLSDKISYRFVDDLSAYSVKHNLSDSSLDFALVDGQKRQECSLQAFGLLKPGGVFVLDNSDRYIPVHGKPRTPNARTLVVQGVAPEWAPILDTLSHWRYLRFTDGVTETLVAIKPT